MLGQVYSAYKLIFMPGAQGGLVGDPTLLAHDNIYCGVQSSGSSDTKAHHALVKQVQFWPVFFNFKLSVIM